LKGSRTLLSNCFSLYSRKSGARKTKSMEIFDVFGEEREGKKVGI
jgi:hypothetical protein